MGEVSSSPTIHADDVFSTNAETKRKLEKSDSCMPGIQRQRRPSNNEERPQFTCGSIEPVTRSRAQSTGSRSGLINKSELHNVEDFNRTMLFQIAKTEVALISPDKKSLMFHKNFKDISHCSQVIIFTSVHFRRFSQ